MPGYLYDPNDGMIHTRYTDLVRCTEKSVVNVVKEMLLGQKRFSGGITNFGAIRHDMFHEESLETGRTPAVFKEVGIDMPVDLMEQELVMQITPKVVLHSRIDAYSRSVETVIDYKTITHEGTLQKVYKSQKQLYVYAMQLMNAGEPVKHRAYLAERWSIDPVTGERVDLLGYEVMIDDITPLKIAETHAWLKDRATRLEVAIDLYRQRSDIVRREQFIADMNVVNKT